MTRRYREPVRVGAERGARGALRPHRFAWRGRRYEVVGVLGCWREEASWWVGAGTAVPHRELWRVEAAPGDGGPSVVCELVREPAGWRIDRVWD